MRSSVNLPDEPAAADQGTRAIPVDSAKKQSTASPFARAGTRDKRSKVFAWGESGAGKTTLALQFPRPVVIDLEGGTDLYGDAFNFDVVRATTADEVMQAIDWLLTHVHEYRTVVIDPISVYWDALQKKWSGIFLKRNKGSKGFKFEFYDLQPRDWMTIKAEFKDLIRKLIALDMNVVVTARHKVQYADGAYMKAIGETFDGEKSLPYLFDIVLRLYRDEKGRFLAECQKDRSNKLPKTEFECSFGVFENVYDEQSLSREAVPVGSATEEQKQRIRGAISQVGMAPEQVTRRLSAYGADSLDDLTEQQAQTILAKLESALRSQDNAGQAGKEV